MKRKEGSVVSATILADGGVQFDVAGCGVLVVDPAKMSGANRLYAMAHGIKQRGVDAAALSRDTTNGQSATAADKYAAIKRVVDHLNSGAEEWSMAAGEGGGRSLTVEAIMRVKGYKTYEEAEGMVAAFAKKSYEGDTKKALAFLRTGARVMEAMDAIRKERAVKPVIDADKALEEIGGAG